MAKDRRALLWGEVCGHEPQPFELDRTSMDLADIQKAVLRFMLDPLQCKVHQRSLPNSDQGFLRERAGPLELEAGQNF